MGAIYMHGELSVVSVELRFSADGKSWAKVRLASKEQHRGPDGAWVDGETTYIDGMISGKQAENLVESVVPGDQVVITGKIINKPWVTDAGEKRDGWRINIASLGISTRFTTAPTEKSRKATAPAVKDDAGDADIFSTPAPPQGLDEPPF